MGELPKQGEKKSRDQKSQEFNNQGHLILKLRGAMANFKH